jgi:hypothetical protein
VHQSRRLHLLGHKVGQDPSGRRAFRQGEKERFFERNILEIFLYVRKPGFKDIEFKCFNCFQAFSGRDASQAFLAYHRRLFPHNRVKSAFEKKDDRVQYSTEDHADFLELCEKLDKVLPRMKSFAPWHYYLKVAFLLFSAFTLEMYMHLNVHYVWYLCGLQGLLYALIGENMIRYFVEKKLKYFILGLNIQHDANHGAISRYPIVNRVLGASQNWIGGSAISWIHQHVVQVSPYQSILLSSRIAQKPSCVCRQCSQITRFSITYIRMTFIWIRIWQAPYI